MLRLNLYCILMLSCSSLLAMEKQSKALDALLEAYNPVVANEIRNLVSQIASSSPAQDSHESQIIIKDHFDEMFTAFDDNTILEDALSHRLSIIKFPPLSRKEKKIVGKDYLRNTAQSQGYLLLEKDYEMLKEILDADTHDGVRVLIKVIESYVAHRIESDLSFTS